MLIKVQKKGKFKVNKKKIYSVLYNVIYFFCMY